MFYILFDFCRCGARYQLYLTAENDFGVSDRSESVSGSTGGHDPSPPSQKDILTVNSTSIDLNLAAWEDGGCPISSYVIEYRTQGGDWVMVNNNARMDQFPVSDLQANTK